jgi:hypothetical protein
MHWDEKADHPSFDCQQASFAPAGQKEKAKA